MGTTERGWGGEEVASEWEEGEWKVAFDWGPLERQR